MGFEFKGRGPDVLDLVIALDNMVDVAVAASEDEDEHPAVFYKGSFLGVVLPVMKYHELHGINTGGKDCISLAPVGLLVPRPASCSVEEFEHSLRNILTSASTGWTLICERDCGQETVVELDYEEIGADEVLEQFFAFLNGHAIECPTFMIVKNA